MPTQQHRGFLLVPIRADALCLREARAVIDAPADFSKLPFVDSGERGTRDVNSGTAHTSDQLLSLPFSDLTARLERGVHLHWAMPDALTWARSVPSANRSGEQAARVDFPAVPNRWLVVRSGAGLPERRWIVESDYLWPRGTVRTAEQVSFPAPDGNGFRYLGRAVALDEWSEGEEHLPKLTVVGYGDPTFAALYPSSRNVFAFHDEETESLSSDDLALLTRIDPPLCYDVFGWFAESAQDPLQAELAQLGDAQGLRAAVERSLEWRLDEPSDVELPARTICYARVRFQVPATHASADLATVARDVQVAVGNTDTEALSAWIAQQLSGGTTDAEALRIEDHLEALHLTASMRGLQADLGPKFEEARHARAFTPAGRGSLWEVRPEAPRDVSSSAAASDERARQRLLPPEFARRQQRLNELQLEYDRASAELDSLRHALYADWRRYMTCCYVPDVLRNPYLDPDVAKRHVERQVALFRLLSAYVGRLEHDPAGPTWSAAAGPGRAALDVWASEELDHLLETQRAPFRAWLDGLRRGLPLAPSLASRLSEALSELHASVERNNRIGQLASAHAQALVAAANTKGPKRTVNAARRSATVAAVTDFQREWKELFGDLEVVAGWDARLYQRVGAFVEQLGVDAGLDAGIAALRTWLASLNATFPRWVLHQTPAPRFWAPNDPVILLAGPGVKSTDRHGEDHLEAADGLLHCLRLDVEAGTFLTRLDQAAAALVARLDELESAWSASNDGARAPGIRNSDGDPWHPLIVEWKVRVSGIPRGANADSARDATPTPRRRLSVTEPPDPDHGRQPFSPDFIHAHYALGEMNSEVLGRTAHHAADDSAATFVGRSILTPFAREKLELELEVFLVGQIRQYLEARKLSGELDEFEASLALLDPTKPGAGQRLLALLDDPARSSALRDWEHRRFVAAFAPEHDATERLSPLAIMLRARATLAELRDKGRDIQSQTLGGFHDALLMQRRTLQLPVADPLGFPEYRAFTDAVVAPIVGRANTTSPESTLPFHPLRTGEFKFVDLHLVDTWGRVVKLDGASRVVRPQRMDWERDDQEWISLAPRITQPARVQFRWLSAADEQVESIADPATSPICGWFVPNDLDGSLHVYDGAGHALGYLDPLGRWRTPPGRSGPPTPQDIANPHLARSVSWIVKCSRAAAWRLAGQRGDVGATPSTDDHSRFINDFGQVVARALDAIDPDGFEEHDSRALLVARPMALVRATLELQLGGLPATHQSWESFRASAERGRAPRTDSWTAVKLPVRIGQHDQLGDGVVGYWVEDGRGGFRTDRFFAPQSQAIAAEAEDPNLVLWREPGESLDLEQSFEDPPQVLSLLVDPRGLVHCTTGLLPTKSLTIPKAHYADALKNLEVSFLTAPILTPPLAAELPLPNEPQSTWTWRQRDGSNWTELTAAPVIEREFVRRAFLDGDAVWQRLVERGWIDPLEDPGRAVIRPKGSRKHAALAGSESDGWNERQTQIQHALDTGARALRAAPTQARLGTTFEIREGWLALQHPVPLD